MLIKFLQKTILFASVVVFVAAPWVVIAQDGQFVDPELDLDGKNDYQLLEPIGEFINKDTSSTLGGFLDGAFKLGVAVATALAVLMIVIGGVQYMGSESFFKKDDAKDRIQMALLGLLLALGSFVVLQTINKDLVEFDIVNTLNEVAERVKTKAEENSGGGTGGGSTSIPPTGEELEIRQRLAAVGIGVNNDPCPPGSSGSGCTNLVGLGNAIPGIIAFKQSCEQALGSSCSITITGGSEPGHATHGPGVPIIDIRRDSTVLEYLIRNNNGVEQTPIGTLYHHGNDEYVDEGSHFHVCYGISCPIQGR